MTKNLLALVGCLALSAACNSDNAAPTNGARTVSLNNKTLSLAVSQTADGRVSGQWTEEVARGARITVQASCLSATANQAWVGGVITESEMPSLKGMDAVIRVDAGGGTSYTVMGTGSSCNSRPPMPLLRAKGTVASLK